MKIRSIYRYILPIFLTLLISCEYEVPGLRGVEDEGMLYVRILAGVYDTTAISVSPTSPIRQEKMELPVMETSIEMTVNGKPAAIQKAEYKNGSSLPEGTLYTTVPIKPGDRLAVSATSYGSAPIHAETVMPGEAPEFDVVLQQVRISPDEYKEYINVFGGYVTHQSDAVRFSVKFKDDPETEDRYALRLIKYTTENNEWEIYVDESAGFLVREHNDLSISDRMPLFLFKDIFGASSIPHSSLVLTYFTDSNLNGQEIEKEYMMFHEDGFRYRVQLFRLSEELYNAAEASYLMNMSTLGTVGMAPIYPYTNIKGGLGCFAAASMRETAILNL